MDDEAAVAGRDGGEVDRGLNSDRGLAEHHEAVARLLTGIVGATSTHGSDDEVVEAIAVDVAGRGHRPAGEIALVLAVDHEAAGAGRDHGKVDLRGKAGRLAEDNIAVARKWARVEGAITKFCPDDEVIEAIAVDVTGGGDRPAGSVVRVLAMDDEAADPGGHIHQIDRHVFRSASRRFGAVAGLVLFAGLREQAGTRVKAARDRLVASSSREWVEPHPVAGGGARSRMLSRRQAERLGAPLQTA